MPITIKEILNSDTMSAFVEKVNFNFDQLILAGGGPPGPQGLQGVAGPIGPQGKRGDHWFTGASAFGQTADHNPSLPLQVQDNFLDENGDIYNYFDAGGGLPGSTGWNFSGINLKGATGATGATGGGTEWNMYLSEHPWGALPVGSGYYGPKNVTTTGTSNLDFLIPESIDKNSIFLGDPAWAFTNLINFGWNYPVGVADGTATPLLTLIQRDMNLSGMNGLAFGGYGLDDAPHGSSWSNKTTNYTDAKTFTYLGYRQNEISIGSGTYKSWFGIRSLGAPIEINVGDPGLANTLPLKLSANNISLDAYEQGDESAKYIRLLSDFYAPIGTSFIDTIRGIELNTKQNVQTNNYLNTPFYNAIDGNSVFSYIGLQNAPGAVGNLDGSWGVEHPYGTVIIGPTYNSSQGTVLGISLPQALGISRKITIADSKDAAIRFMFDGVAGPTQNNLWASTIGTIVPIRFTDAIDALVVSAGIGSGLMPNRDSGRGGRLGFSNNALRSFKPLFPSHTRITWDDKVFGGALGSAPTSGDSNNPWFAAWDYKHKTNINLLGTTSYQPQNDVGIGFMTVAENWAAPSGLTGGYYPMPMIQSYYTEDYNGIPNDSNSGKSQGINSPHLFMQYGDEDSNGNLAIGFKPDGSVSSPYSKLHVNGGIVIGSTANFYHSPWVNRIKDGGLFEKAIVQGALSFNTQFSTRYFYSGAVLDALAGPSGTRWGLATYDPVLGRKFISRGTTDTTNPAGTWIDGPSANATAIPDFSGPDLRTGMKLLKGEGHLMIPSASSSPVSTAAPTVGYNLAATWKAAGEYNYVNNYDYPVFRADSALAHSMQSINLDTIPQEITNIDISEVGFVYKYKRIWYVIPSNTTTVFLDLSNGRNNADYFNSSGNLVSTGDGYRLYINGTISNVSGGGSVPAGRFVGRDGYPSVGFKVQEGHYNGQILNIIVQNVNPFNYSYLESNNLQSTGAAVTGANVTGVPDSLILAAEPMWNQSLTAGLVPGESPNPNKVYPLPYGYPDPAIGGTSISVSATQLNKPWTQQGTTPWMSGTGYGAFRLNSWYSLNLIWKFFDTPSRGINGAWYELGREKLVPPFANGRNYPTPPTLVYTGPDPGLATFNPTISWRMTAASSIEIEPKIISPDNTPQGGSYGYGTPLNGVVTVTDGPMDIQLSSVYLNGSINSPKLWIYNLGTTTPISSLPLGLTGPNVTGSASLGFSPLFSLPTGTYSFRLQASFGASIGAHGTAGINESWVQVVSVT